MDKHTARLQAAYAEGAAMAARKRSKAKKDEVMVFDETRGSNDKMILDLAVLGYLKPSDKILDCTYGLGVFWKLWKPNRAAGGRLCRTDLNPALSPDRKKGVDYRDMPFKDGEFDVVVFDPHYQLNGTSTGKGPSAKDPRYDVTEYRPWKVTHEEINEGIVECLRVLRKGGILIVKCQDQVSSGAMRWQTTEFSETARAHGAQRIFHLHVEGYRSQNRQVQVHPGNNYSTALVFRKKKLVDPANPTPHPPPFVPAKYRAEAVAQ